MIKHLLSPFTIFTLLFLLMAIAGWRGKQKWFKIFATLGALWLLLFAAPWVPRALVARLEGKYPRSLNISKLPSHGRYHILVLGAGHATERGLPANDQLNPGALQRLAEGLRLYRQLPNSVLITSGNSMSGGTPQARVLADAALSLGADAARVRLQAEPATTYEEAKAYKRKFSKEGATLILVTAASHMPRAMLLFRSQGLAPHPAPTAHLVKRNRRARLHARLTTGSLRESETWTTETAGYLHARYFLLSDAEKQAAGL